jgi:hypothetical protein
MLPKPLRSTKESLLMLVFLHPFARRYIESQVLSALPDAPVVTAHAAAPVARPRRVAAAVLLTLADRLAPEPVERSRWQSG